MKLPGYLLLKTQSLTIFAANVGLISSWDQFGGLTVGIKFFARLFLLCLTLPGAGFAQSTEAARQEAAKAFEAAMASATKGPAQIALATQGTLSLPQGRLFIAKENAVKALNAMGNPGSDPRIQGLIFPADEGDWFVVVRFDPAGYIKDDDAKSWNADEMLQNFKDGTEQANSERAKLGIPAMEIVGWAQTPTYDAAKHHLVWALSSKDKDQQSTASQGVNFNTYVLGREGYFSMNLVTDLKSLDALKPQAQVLLSALSFDDGKRYADFNEKTDKVAEYGLAALVAGVAAKKLGLIAVVLGFIVKFYKIGLIAVFAFGGGALKFFKNRKRSSKSD
jgi:uncharacterized membrane-anchored protein